MSKKTSILFISILIIGVVLMFSNLFKSKQQKKIIESPEELFSVVKVQLNEEYGLTEKDIDSLYTVQVYKFAEPQPPGVTVSGQEPKADDFVYYNVIMQSSLYICLQNEELLTNIFMSTNKYGDIVRLAGRPISYGVAGDKDFFDDSQREKIKIKNTFMKLSPEKVEIRDQVDEIFKNNNLKGLEFALEPGEKNALKIYDTLDSIIIRKGEFRYGYYHYEYNKKDETLIDIAKERDPGSIHTPIPNPFSQPSPKLEKFLIQSPFKSKSE